MPKPTPLQVANHFIILEPWVSHLKLQKLCYCAYGWHFIYHDDIGRLFEEKVQAWDFGPVFPSLYRQLKPQADPNQRFVSPVLDLNKPNEGPPLLINDEHEYLHAFILWLSKRYRKYSGNELVGITHRAGSPWEQAVRPYWEKRPFKFMRMRVPPNLELDDDAIRKEFEYLSQPLEDKNVSK